MGHYLHFAPSRGRWLCLAAALALSAATASTLAAQEPEDEIEPAASQLGQPASDEPNPRVDEDQINAGTVETNDGPQYQWLLSVINGGAPRGDGLSEDKLESLTALPLESWKTPWPTLGAGIWELKDQSANRKDIYFGLEGASPIAGDFNGDGLTEVGLFRNGEWFIDLNGNGRWDNDDLWAHLGNSDSQPVVGDWDGDGKADIGVLAAAGSIDSVRILRHGSKADPRADAVDITVTSPRGFGATVAGDFVGRGHPMLAVVDLGEWVFTALPSDEEDQRPATHFGSIHSQPLAGDFTGDGIDDLVVYSAGTWYVDVDSDGRLRSEDYSFELGATDDLPVIGDWNDDGKADFGVYRFDREASKKLRSKTQESSKPSEAAR